MGDVCGIKRVRYTYTWPGLFLLFFLLIAKVSKFRKKGNDSSFSYIPSVSIFFLLTASRKRGRVRDYSVRI
jgi:hypothetical protein